MFVGYAFKPSTSSLQQDNVNHLVTALIALSALDNGSNAEAKMGEISQAARTSMDKAVKVMPVTDFVNAVLSMIESGEHRVSMN